MKFESLIFWIVIDPLTFLLGSIGGYVFFREFVDMDHFPNIQEMIKVIKRHWFASLFLLIAIIYFFFRIIISLQNP